MQKWSEIEEQLYKIGFKPETVEVVRKLTAPIRRRQRIRDAWAAALEYCGGDESKAAALCWAESKGLYGGGLKRPGAGTTRHTAFAGLGKGRRNANDGPAWTEAIRSAPDEAGYCVYPIVKNREILACVVPSEGTGKGKTVTEVPLRSLLTSEELLTLCYRLVAEQIIDPVDGAALIESC